MRIFVDGGFAQLSTQCFYEILFAEVKKVLRNIILKRKDVTSIYFLHTVSYATAKLVSSTDLVSW